MADGTAVVGEHERIVSTEENISTLDNIDPDIPPLTLPPASLTSFDERNSTERLINALEKNILFLENEVREKDNIIRALITTISSSKLHHTEANSSHSSSSDTSNNYSTGATSIQIRTEQNASISKNNKNNNINKKSVHADEGECKNTNKKIIRRRKRRKRKRKRKTLLVVVMIIMIVLVIMARRMMKVHLMINLIVKS